MNFLAHALLSANEPDILVGNFIADSIKGNQIEAFSPAVQRGIMLHRSIDQFTDTHEEVKKAVSLMRPYFQKYTPVVMDIYFDYFLSINWDSYSDESLKSFVRQVYFCMMKRFTQLPPRSRYILPWMIAQNWMASYGDYKELDAVFRRMAGRTRFVSNMENAVSLLKKHEAELQQHFNKFYPELEAHCTEWLITHPL